MGQIGPDGFEWINCGGKQHGKRKCAPEREVLQAIVRRLIGCPRLRVWRQNTGAAKYGRTLVRFGTPGQADLSGILDDGRRLEIEVKAKDGRVSPDQIAFGEMITRMGGVYVLARSVLDVEVALSEYL